MQYKKHNNALPYVIYTPDFLCYAILYFSSYYIILHGSTWYYNMIFNSIIHHYPIMCVMQD